MKLKQYTHSMFKLARRSPSFVIVWARKFDESVEEQSLSDILLW